MKRGIISWSGGKDSCLALEKTIEQGIQPVVLISVIDEETQYSKSNGVSKDVLIEQAKMMNLPISCIPAKWENYEENLIKELINNKKKYCAEYAIFGDMDIVHHKEFEEKVCSKSNLMPVLPLWGQERINIAYEVVNTGIKTKISVIDCNYMKDECLGKEYDQDFLLYLKDNNIDLCGENGEFHSLVYYSKSFKRPIYIEKESKINIDNYSLLIYKTKRN